MPSRHTGSADNSSAVWPDVAVIIKTKVEIETKHGKIPTDCTKKGKKDRMNAGGLHVAQTAV